LSTTRKYLHNLVFILSNILFPVVSFSYAARILGPEGIGKAQIVLNLAQYFVLIAALGIPVYGVREIAKAASNSTRLGKIFSELVCINLITTLILLGIYLVLILVTGWFTADIDLYLLGGVSILAGFLSIDWFFSGSEQFEYLSVRSVAVKTVALVTLFLFVRDRQDIFIYLAINILTTIFTNVWNLVKLRNQIHISFKRLNLKRHFQGLGILFLITATVSVYAVGDTVLLGYLAGEESAGLYTASIKINKLVIPLIASLGVVLIPRITQALNSGNRTSVQELSEKSFAFICLIGIPVSFGLYAFAPEIMVLFSGAGFADAIPAMQITAALPFIIGLGHLFGLQLLIPGGYEKKYLIATFFGMITSLVLNFSLISAYRQNGAAVANMTSEIIVTMISIWFVRKYVSIKVNWTLVLTSTICCLIFIPMAWLLRYILKPPVWCLGAGVVSAVLIYGFMQVVLFRESYSRALLNSLSGYLFKTRDGR